MKLQTLIENTVCRSGLECEHGLSLYLETGGERILFDAGRGDMFLRNAEKMGVSISEVSRFVLSHAHNDHGGGITAFLHANQSAPLYISRYGLLPHYALRQNGAYEDIGISPALAQHPRIVQTGNVFSISTGLTLFSDVTTAQHLSLANQTLFEGGSNGFRPDRFLHEQNLAVEEHGKLILIAGCAHRGIVNILNRFTGLFGRAPDVAIGGFHLDVTGDVPAPTDFVCHLAETLRAFPTRFYTGHCTGLHAYSLLRERMGDQVSYLAAGSVLEL